MTMYDIQLNESGTRHLNLRDDAFQIIDKYHLFQQFVNSTGYVTEHDLDRLKLTVRNLLDNGDSDTKDLLGLCNDVIFHEKMKAYGLRGLIEAYRLWLAQQTAAAPQEETPMNN